MAKSLFSQDLVNGTFDWVNDGYSLAIFDDTYSGFNSDTYMSEVTGQQGASIALTGKEIQVYNTEVFLLADQGGTFGVISAAQDLNSIILFRDTGDPATSYLIAELSTFSVTGLPYTTTGIEVDIEYGTFVGINAGKGKIMEIGS